jgi:hypothetical protein
MSNAERPTRRPLAGTRHALAAALALLIFGGLATSAGATDVMIVTKGEIPPTPPKKVRYFSSIQAAVDATTNGDWVLIEPGTYDEEVKVTKTHSNIWIRGMDRNGVVIDGQHRSGNGIEVVKTNGVSIENLTVKDFDTGSECDCGNEIWWNGGAGSGKIGAHGWWGRYLTAYDTGLNGGYGIFTGNMTEGEWENVYASGFNDSGMYVGACQECDAVINKATMNYNALGYSGSNSGGNLIIENSTFRNNTAGIAPNSENPGDPPPPQNGSCGPNHPYKKGNFALPTFTSTNIARCTIIRDNVIEDNNNLTAPSNGSTEIAPWGAGIELPGDYADLIEGNTIRGNPSDGVMGFEYPNPFPPGPTTIYFQLAGNKIANNVFEGNGYGPVNPEHDFEGDVMLQGGFFGEQRSTNNCLSGNTFNDPVYPAGIEGTWGCQNATTPNPNLGVPALEYIEEMAFISQFLRTPEPQPTAEAESQETMPEPCKGVPKNPLCP